MAAAEFLCRVGFVYVAGEKRLPGSPDFVHETAKCVVFVNGCFWHFCRDCNIRKLIMRGCLNPEECYDSFVVFRKTTSAVRSVVLPKSDPRFWQKKLLDNVARDARNVRALERLGYAVVTIWEHDMKTQTARDAACLNALKVLRESLVISKTKHLWDEYGRPGQKVVGSRYYRAYCMYCFTPVRCVSKRNALINFAFCESCHPATGDTHFLRAAHCGTTHARDEDDALDSLLISAVECGDCE